MICGVFAMAPERQLGLRNVDALLVLSRSSNSASTFARSLTRIGLRIDETDVSEAPHRGSPGPPVRGGPAEAQADWLKSMESGVQARTGSHPVATNEPHT
ncbi:hypothetical protein GCM10011320_55400 [Neoroseomonas lacus]|uniref:Uncharacterized protein n=1 Tax=Neoroseomonas lacus TaxID=287609 RepID=A0A917L5F1_9PROT|nr:hypothetical protein GCM10011320_55400 [Neoroseomonas lacus]